MEPQGGGGGVTEQGRPHSLKMVQRAEGGKGKDNRERIRWFSEALVRKLIL